MQLHVGTRTLQCTNCLFIESFGSTGRNEIMFNVVLSLGWTFGRYNNIRIVVNIF